MVNKLLNVILIGIGITFVFIFVRIYVHNRQELKQCREKIDVQEKVFENILEGQKLMSLYKPKWNKYFPFYYDTINSVVQSEDKIILRISENSCHSCIEAIKSIIAERFDFKDFIVITSYKDERVANQIKILKSFPFRINLADLSSKLGDKNINFIYCFKMGADRQIRNMFILIKEIPEYNSNYFEILLAE